MKTFQQIALVSAIVAAPFAVQADLTPMDDSLVGNTIGQAGVTIEIDHSGDGSAVGEVEYIDEGSVILITLVWWVRYYSCTGFVNYDCCGSGC
jgi:hypothetical protein